MAFRMRSSKFRHVYGKPAKKEHCYECIKITKNAHDSHFCAVNPRFLAVVTESAGGGAFVVIPVEKTGRVDMNSPKVCGHSGPVLDIKWNPFHDDIIASCSDDATIKVWKIPQDGLKSNLSDWLVDLHGHQRRVGFIEWHPTAENILLSAGYDFKCILWNTESAEPITIISCHTDTIFSISWNRDGSLFATTSKDKKIRVIDPRAGTVIQEGQGHVGPKASKVVFLGDRNKLVTTGFSRMSERQYAIWDSTNLSKPLKLDSIDSSSGILFPYYDYDTRVLYLAGKGDGNIRYFEIVDDAPYIHYLNQYQSSSPQRGLGLMPKRGVDPSQCEITRFYKLHTVKNVCEPISMVVPRKSELFQEDLYPPTASICPSLTADEWMSGQDRGPILVSLKSGETRFERSRKRHPKPVTNIPRVKKEVVLPPASPHRVKDGAISNSPTITTYKAVKRAAVTSSPAPPGVNRMSNVSSPRRQANVSPMIVTTPTKLPQSVMNIRKMSVNSDDAATPPANVTTHTHPSTTQNTTTAANQQHEQHTNTQNSSKHDNVNDKVQMFEKKRSRTVSQTTRMTNHNETVHVDKKVWSSTAANHTNGVLGDAHNTHPTNNYDCIPRTDPETRAPLKSRYSRASSFPASAPASVPIHSSHNGTLYTDDELRKAYFQQVEQIQSLKEQISLKDHRIRQLEDELELVPRPNINDTAGESSC